MRQPSIDDYEGDWDAFSDACEAYEDYESYLEDKAKEKYYEEKY